MIALNLLKLDANRIICQQRIETRQGILSSDFSNNLKTK